MFILTKKREGSISFISSVTSLGQDGQYLLEYYSLYLLVGFGIKLTCLVEEASHMDE